MLVFVRARPRSRSTASARARVDSRSFDRDGDPKRDAVSGIARCGAARRATRVAARARGATIDPRAHSTHLALLADRGGHHGVDVRGAERRRVGDARARRGGRGFFWWPHGCVGFLGHSVAARALRFARGRRRGELERRDALRLGV